MLRQRLDKWIKDGNLIRIEFRANAEIILGRIMKFEKDSILVYYEDRKQLVNLALKNIKSLQAFDLISKAKQIS